MNKRQRSVKPQNPHTENKDKFSFIWLGQTICKYKVPFDIFNVINGIYETNFRNLPDAHKQLVGKIGKENSLFFCMIIIGGYQHSYRQKYHHYKSF